jgi:hypothetical protein
LYAFSGPTSALIFASAALHAEVRFTQFGADGAYSDTQTATIHNGVLYAVEDDGADYTTLVPLAIEVTVDSALLPLTTFQV